MNGKKAPGREEDGAPLHRFFGDHDPNNKIRGSRRKTQTVCRKYWGVNYATSVPGTPRECDEYPFATTYENAALVDENTMWNFAAAAISRSHNKKAGEIYQAFLRTEHLLDGDAFYVHIR
ncbi:NucA/NucB deoxyribonuclease domain-containing protein [Saccharothrix stipae]